MFQALADCLEPALPLGAQLVEFIHHHDGIVDQQAQRDDQARHRHLVQRVPEQAEQDQHQADRQRNGHPDHDGRPPAHGHEQDSDDDESRKQQILRQAIQPVIRVTALVEHGFDLQSRWRRGGEPVCDGAGPLGPFVDTLARRDVDPDQHGPAVVLECLPCRRVGKPLLHGGDIGHADRRSVRSLQQRDLSDTGNAIELAAHLEPDRAAVAAQATGGRLAVGRCDQRGGLPEGQARRGKCLRVNHHADFLVRHAIGFGFFRARQSLELVFKVQRETPHHRQGRVALAGPGQADHEGRGPHIKPLHFRRTGAGGKLRARLVDLRPDQGPGVIHFRRRQVFANFNANLREAGPAG